MLNQNVNLIYFDESCIFYPLKIFVMGPQMGNFKQIF